MIVAETTLTPAQSGQLYDAETAAYLSFGTRIFQGVMFADTDAAHVRKLYDMMAPAKGATIIDMGCGIGEVARLMLEIDETLLFHCVTNSEIQFALLPDDVDGIKCDFHHVPLPDGMADVVMFAESIGYAGLANVLDEARRLLKPGGKLFIKDAVCTTGKPIIVPGWEYVFHTAQIVRFCAQRAGFKLTSEIFPAGNVDKFAAFLANIKGPSLSDIPVKPVVWVFEKQAPPEWDSPEWRVIRNREMLKWMNGNQNAVDCVVGLSRISETWDDLIDRDKEVGPEAINQAFVTAAIDLQVNPFYKENESLFFAMNVTGINAWMDATKLEKSDDKKWRMLSFYIRNFAYEIMTIAAFRAGGWEHLRKVSLEMRQFCAHESYDQWEFSHA